MFQGHQRASLWALAISMSISRSRATATFRPCNRPHYIVLIRTTALRSAQTYDTMTPMNTAILPEHDAPEATLPVTLLPAARAELPAIIHRMLAGEAVSVIAKDHSVSHQAMYKWLSNGLGTDGVKDLRRQVHAIRLCETEVLIMTANSKLELARAALIGKRTEWLAERACPEIWGKTIEGKPTHPVVVRVSR